MHNYLASSTRLSAIQRSRKIRTIIKSKINYRLRNDKHYGTSIWGHSNNYFNYVSYVQKEEKTEHDQKRNRRFIKIQTEFLEMESRESEKTESRLHHRTNQQLAWRHVNVNEKADKNGQGVGGLWDDITGSILYGQIVCQEEKEGGGDKKTYKTWPKISKFH